MYLLLFLFFGSLFGILFMIGKKLAFLDNHREIKEELLLDIPYLDEWKEVSIKNTKKIAYNALVSSIRIYIRSSNFLKEKYQEIKKAITEKRKKNILNNEKKEISKFLKTVSDYKRKIREIKYRIKEEEEERGLKM